MDPHDENIVTYRTLLGGYEQALRRFTDASKTRNASQVFLPLFEALNWAVALDDQVRALGSRGHPIGLVLGELGLSTVTLLTRCDARGTGSITSGPMR